VKLIKPKTQEDVIQNRRAVAEHIRGLAQAAQQIRDEEQRKRGQRWSIASNGRKDS
jgi:hypothetical protein